MVALPLSSQCGDHPETVCDVSQNDYTSDECPLLDPAQVTDSYIEEQ